MLRVHEDDLEWDDNNLPSYQGEPFTGEAVEYLDDGRLLSLTTYVDGIDEGPFRAWSGDGVLIVEGQSHRGKPVGTQREWFDSGAPKYEREYSERGHLLRVRRWDEDGTVTLDQTYPPK